MTAAKISIVTPTYNQGDFIEETINSVLENKYPNLEYIIIDGGSTDGTVEKIKKYSAHLKYWVSEKDAGQANAINKGLQYCTGEIFNWLNSDDYLQPGALQKIAEAFREEDIDLVAGSVNNFSVNSNEIINNQHLFAAGLMRWERGVKFIQPGVWMRREKIIQCGGINDQFHYAFDWDLLIRYLFRFPKVKYLDDVVVNFRLHGGSKTGSVIDKFAEEERLIIETLYTNHDFRDLHPVCKWKIDRTNWTKFLNDTMVATEKSKAGKVFYILTHLDKQPADRKVTRMTLGAIRSIITS